MQIKEAAGGCSVGLQKRKRK